MGREILYSFFFKLFPPFLGFSSVGAALEIPGGPQSMASTNPVGLVI
jgi:hypothetical protein